MPRPATRFSGRLPALLMLPVRPEWRGAVKSASGRAIQESAAGAAASPPNCIFHKEQVELRPVRSDVPLLARVRKLKSWDGCTGVIGERHGRWPRKSHCWPLNSGCSGGSNRLAFQGRGSPWCYRSSHEHGRSRWKTSAARADWSRWHRSSDQRKRCHPGRVPLLLHAGSEVCARSGAN